MLINIFLFSQKSRVGFLKKIAKGYYYKVDDNWKGGLFVKSLEDGQPGKWPLVEWVIDKKKQRLPLTFFKRKATKKDKNDIIMEALTIIPKK